VKKVVYLLVIALFVVSCAKELQSIAPTLSVTSTDSPLLTKTLTTTPLVISTVTETPSKHSPTTKTDTLTPDAVLLTQEAVISSCASTEREWYTKHLSTTFFKNRQWEAIVCSDSGIYTKVWNSSIELTWTVPAYPDEPIAPELSWYWKPYLWSDNRRYLYLEAACLCFIDSPWLIYSSGFGLSRLNLETGQVDIWLKPNDSGYSFDFSEGGELLALSPPDLPGTIIIRDLTSGKDRTLIFKKQYSILEYRWTPDKSRLVIFTQEYGSSQSENGFSVFVYSFDSEVLEKLVEKDNLDSSFPTEEFIEPRIYISDLTDDILFLSDIFNENNFQLNVRSGELVRVTELMTPTIIP